MKNYLYNIFEKWGTNIFVYSDPHFGDLESYKFRFVKNTEIRDGKKYYQTFETIWEDEQSLECSMHEFDEMQIKNINSIAGKASTLIILGDVGDLECVKKLRAKRKILIMGNHDKGASNYKRVVDDRYYITPEISSSSWSLLNENECHSKYLKYKEDVYNHFKHQYRDKITDEIHNVFSNELPGSYFLGEVVLRKPGNANFKNVNEIPNHILDKVKENLDFIKKDDSYTKGKTEEELIIEEANIIAEKIDNHLFDEVYEGPLMINDKVILSHEPIFPTLPFVYNVHGHVHNAEYKGDEHHLNCCAEAINYKPINLLKLFKTGKLKHIDSIHRMTINNAVVRKAGKYL